MNVADVRYTGPMRTHYHQGPSGTRYRFVTTTEENRPTAVESVADAEHFAGNDVYDVDWTPQGRLLRVAHDPATDAAEVVSNWSWQLKQQIVSAVDEIDAVGNDDKSEVEEALEQHLQELNQHQEGL